MVNIANPIYDVVFKFLLEDMRIAKTILSALLKKEVVEVVSRRQEYSNATRDNISMFRIDFGATVREADGTMRLIHIELQKTWVETETLRFRQYLGAHYANVEDLDMSNGYAIPMVTVYLLGHRVGDIEEPILYVNHKAYDYDGNEVTKGMPDPFVESLLHDSIIVQIPRLHGQVNNRLEQVLNIFDQTRRDRQNHQVLYIDETQYDGDEEMQHILHRLLIAAADSRLRRDMNAEDEFFLAIENRDTAIMMRDKKIQQQDAKLQEQDEKIEQQDAKIEEQDAKLQQQDAKLQQQDAKIEEQDAKLHNAAQLLLASGMSAEDIQATLGIRI